MTAEELVATRARATYALTDTAGTASEALQVGKYARRTEITYRPAAEVNATFPEGWSPPYKPSTRVTEFTTTVDDVYVRVHGENNMARSWMMKPEAIQGLRPAEIQSKYALPELPTYMSEVHVPVGARIRTGVVNPVFDGVGNATQYELLQRLPTSAFKNTVRLGQ
jgi:filamentous hemagglutinin